MTDQLNSSLDKGRIFNDLKTEISTFGEIIEADQQNDNQYIDYEKFELQLFAGLQALQTEVETEDSQSFRLILDKLKDPNKKLETNDISTISKILETLETKNITDTYLEQLNNTVNELKKTKSSLVSLRQGIKIPPALEKKKQKLEDCFNKLKSFKTEHPIRTRTLVLLLPAGLLPFFKQEEKTTGIVGEIQNGFYDFCANIMTFFFDLMAPDEIKSLLEDINSLSENISPNEVELLQKLGVGAGLGSIVAGVNEIVDTNKIEQVKTKFRASLPKFVKTVFKRDMDEDQIDRVMVSVNIDEIMKDKQNFEGLSNFLTTGEKSNWNITDAFFEGVTLPFEFSRNLTTALKEEGIITWSDVLISGANGVTNYAYKGLSLLGTGISFFLGNVSPKELGEKLGELYSKSPTEAEEFISIVMYRSGGPVLNMLGSVAKLSSQVLIYTFFDNRSVGDSFEVITNSLKGNLNTHVKFLNELANELNIHKINPDISDNIKKLIDQTEIAIKNIEKNARFVNIYNEIKSSTTPGDDFIKKIPDGVLSQDDILKLKGRDINIVKQFLIDNLKGNGGLDALIGETKSLIGGSLKGLNSSTFVLNDIAKSISSSQTNMASIIRDDTLFGKIKQQFSKFNNIVNGFEIMRNTDRTIFKFANVNDFGDFLENLKILGKESPSALKMLIGKLPIFMVAGLNWGEGETVPDKIKAVGKSLFELIPFVGPFIIASDAIQDRSFTGLGIAGALFTLDTVFLIKGGFKGITRFFAQPFIDVAELIGFASRSGFNIIKFGTDFVKIAPKASTYIGIRNSFKSLATKPKAAIVAVLLTSSAYAYSKISDDEDDPLKNEREELEKAISGNIESINDLDNYLVENWCDFTNEEKAEFFRVSLFTKLGLTNSSLLNDITVQYNNVNDKYDFSVKGMLEKLIFGDQTNISTGKNNTENPFFIDMAISDISSYIKKLDELSSCNFSSK